MRPVGRSRLLGRQQIWAAWRRNDVWWLRVRAKTTLSWRPRSLMTARQVALALCSLVVLLSMTASEATGHSSRQSSPKCAQRQGGVVVADVGARVYEAFPLNGDFLEVYGCVNGSHHVVLLGEPASFSAVGGGGISDILLAGTAVAYEESLNVSCCSKRLWVVVRDLRTGRVLHRVPTGMPITPMRGYVGVGPVVSMVVKSDGAVAWIVEAEDGSPAMYQVHAVDRWGSRVLAAASDIGRTSLALAGGTLYWTQGGRAESAVLR
jgi:hypothetical protein